MTRANVDEAREILEARASELRDELTRIEEAISTLGRDAKPHSTGRNRGPGTRTSSRRGRRNNKRAEQAVELIGRHPGITIKELSEKMGLKGPHYLYRLLPRLEDEQLVSKNGGGGYHLVKT